MLPIDEPETPERARAGETLLAVVVFLLLGAVFTLNPFSTYSDATAMDAYFGGEIEPGSWRWAGSWSWDEEPFKFRILFHGLVDGVAHMLALPLGRSLETYWIAILLCSVGTVAFAAATLNKLLAEVGLDRRTRVFCVGFWALLPPVHMAFVLPVQTKEDFLAYGLFHLGLIAILRRDFRWVAILSVVGALSRETLVLIPLLYAFVARGDRLKSLAPLGLALSVHAALRAGLGADGYDVTRNENFDHSLRVLVSFALVLGVGWVLVLPHLAPRRIGQSFTSVTSWLRPGETMQSATPYDALWLALPLVALALLLTHLFMGRIVEIRISFLMAPWAVLAFGALIRTTRLSLVRLAIPAAFLASVVAGETMGVATLLRGTVNEGLGPFAAQHWWAAVYLQVALALGLLCLVRRA